MNYLRTNLSIIDGSKTGVGTSGLTSFTFGLNTKATNSYSTAIGNKTNVIGINSTAMGLETIAVANPSTARPWKIQCSGFEWFIYGRQC